MTTRPWIDKLSSFLFFYFLFVSFLLFSLTLFVNDC